MVACTSGRTEDTVVAARPQHYNILFLGADDLNDYVQSLGGHPNAITPHLDSLVASSYVFQNAYCPAPLCNPSRAAMMSGLNPSTTGVYDNRQPLRLSDRGRSQVTLPQYFRQHGYFVAGAGKMYHNKFPDAASWDAYFPQNGTQAIFDEQGELVQNEPKGDYQSIGHHSWADLAIDDREMADFRSVQYIEDMLDKSLQEPFFLACGLNKPHTPYFVPKKYFDLYDDIDIRLPEVREDDLEDVPPIGQSWPSVALHQEIIRAGKWQELVKAYLATTSFVDAMVGKAVQALASSQYADNTIIVFWSDHGFHLGEKMHWDKYTLWEEATKNPMLISFPGQGERVNITIPVSLVDLYPTLAELCTLLVPDSLDGHSLVPLIQDEKYDWPYPAVSTYGQGNHGIRYKNYRYIRYQDGTSELYDLAVDPMEFNNLSDHEDYREIEEMMVAFVPATDATPSVALQWPTQSAYFDSVMWAVKDQFD